MKQHPLSTAFRASRHRTQIILRASRSLPQAFPTPQPQIFRILQLPAILLACLLLNTGIHAQPSATPTAAIGTASQSPGVKASSTGSAYQKEIEDWHTRRIENLKAANGWLNLVGLYWLDEGKNSFGSGSQNKVIFPAGSIVDAAGYFERTGATVKLVVQNNAAVKVNDQPVQEAVIYEKGFTSPSTLSYGSLQWTIIQRDDKIGIRLRDLNSPLVTGFKGIDRFPVDPAWRINATLQADAQPRSIAITNVLGQTNQQHTPGRLVFTVDNKEYTLDALEEGDELFIIFADETSGKTTYPAGRFLAVKKPGADGTTIIDFNKAYNPPCAFTGYATCPLPPRQNVLPFQVTAGEKTYGRH